MGLGGGPSTKAEAKPKVTKQAENAGKTLTLNPQSSTLNPKSSTLNLKASTCNPQSSTSNPQSATLNTQHSTLKPSTLDPHPSTLNTQHSNHRPGKSATAKKAEQQAKKAAKNEASGYKK